MMEHVCAERVDCMMKHEYTERDVREDDYIPVERVVFTENDESAERVASGE
jgi:hypothetical protein